MLQCRGRLNRKKQSVDLSLLGIGIGNTGKHSQNASSNEMHVSPTLPAVTVSAPRSVCLHHSCMGRTEGKNRNSGPKNVTQALERTKMSLAVDRSLLSVSRPSIIIQCHSLMQES
jgi:hypothetical protein